MPDLSSPKPTKGLAVVASTLAKAPRRRGGSVRSFYAVAAASVALGLSIGAAVDDAMPRAKATMMEQPTHADSMQPSIELPALRLEFAGGALQLSGRVPDVAERDAIVHGLQAIYGVARVVDHLQIGGVANPAWLSAAFLPDLRGAARATAVLHDARLAIEGVADTALASAAIARSVAGFAARGVRVDNRIEVRP